MIDRQEKFLEELNLHAGMIHKICRVYFAELEVRRDMFQEIVYQLWRSYPSFRGQSKFSTWMYKIALNTALTFQYKASRQPLNARLDDDSAALENIVADEPAESEMEVLYAAINTLNEVERALILLYLEEHTYQEIAGITGLSKTNVSVKLVRIKKKLENIFKHQSYSTWKI